jgi:II/X family phage/plasmid replication protein
MLDSVKLKKPLKDEREAALIEAQVQTMTKTDNGTDTELFRFVGGNLEGSFSNNIAVNVKREVYRRIIPRDGGKPHSIVVQCGWDNYPNGQPKPRPYLTIEGSVHKAMVGHNIYGGPLDPVAGCSWYAAHVCGQLGVNVGDLADWLCLRVDWAECFNLGSFEAVEEYLRSMKLASYPRRKANTYEGEVMFPSSNITTKFYHKGLEFQKNGRRSAVKHCGMEEAESLATLANGILRTEITVKSKRLKLEATTPGNAEMPVQRLSREWLEGLHDLEVSRIFHEGKADMKNVRTHDHVNARLREVYGSVNGRAELLFGVWMQMAALGEQEYKRTVAKPTFYRQRKQLADAGVTWIGSDIGIVQSNCVPLDFSFRRDSPFRMADELPAVAELLAPFRLAA